MIINAMRYILIGMKLLIFAVLIASASGCASLKDTLNPGARRAAIEAQEQAEAERDEAIALAARDKRIAEKRAVKVPGIGLAEFKAVWGEPESTDFIDSKYVLHYKNGGTPTIFVFKNEKLIEFYTDRLAVEKNLIMSEREKDRIERESAREQDRRERQRARAAEAWSNAGQALGQSIQPTPVRQPTTCRSQRGYGGSVTTTCN